MGSKVNFPPASSDIEPITLPLAVAVPALSIVKVTGWPLAAGADISCSWSGILVDH